MEGKLNILYLGCKKDGSAPGDRRRFLGFSALSSNFKVYFNEDDGVKFDVLVCSLGGDLAKALRLSDSIPKLVLDYTNHYLIENSWLKDKFRNPVGSVFNRKELSFKSYKKTILELMHKSDLVICPSITQQNFLKTLDINSARLTDFFGKEVDFKGISFNGNGSLFWEGQAVNLSNIRSITPIFQKRPDILLRIVSDEYFGMSGGKLFRKNSSDYCQEFLPNFEFTNWSAQNVNLAAKKSSLGIIPLDLSDPFVAAKPENKLIFMWMLGLDTLCTPTESYSMLSRETGVDFLCEDLLQWLTAIDRLLSHKKERVERAKYLHNFARTQYSDSALQKKWKLAFEEKVIF